jgi:hypothetical protein
MRFTSVLVSLLLASNVVAAELPEISSNDYGEARNALIADGWEPHRTDDSDCVNREETEWCVRYPEIRFCAGSGLAPCEMVWSRDGEFVTVYTVGEHPKVTGTVAGLTP